MLTEPATRRVRVLMNSARMFTESMWADNIKRVPEWIFSSAYHYVNIPPTSCDYSHIRDCKVPSPGCVVSAISNYTTRMTSQTFQQAKDAFRFAVHFIADIHQPLHVGRSTDLGGNTITVNWFGRQTNLHSVWDGSILQRRVSLDFEGDEKKFFNYLKGKMLIEPWKSKISDWQRCGRTKSLPCPEEWAQESAVLACRYCYDGAVNNTQLTEAYYKRSLPIIEEQIVKGGVRLAATINSIFK